jgi:type II secretory pathway component PulF
MADLTRGGLPLARSLDVLARATNDGASARFLRSLRRDLDSGKSLSQALAGQNGAVGPAYIGLVRAGEAAGAVDGALDELAGLLETEVETRRRIATALVYPALVLALAVAVCAFLTLIVIPRFEFLFHDLGQTLPWPTRALLSSSKIARRAAPWLILAAIASALAIRRATARLKHAAAHALDRIPHVSNAIRAAHVQRWCGLMASLLRGGSTVSEALRLSRQTLRSTLLAAPLSATALGVLEGKSLARSMALTRFFPSTLCELVAAAEESGRLTETFARASEAYRRECDAALRLALALLEPSLVLVMGAVVGFIAVAILLPIFEMSAGMK